MSERPATADGIPNEALGWLAAGALLEWGSMLTLWLGTAAWTDYAFWVLMALAAVAFLTGGFIWIDQATAGPVRPDEEPT